MRILYVIHNLVIGGAETVVVNYVLNLKERGEDVALLELSHKETFLAKKIREHDVPYYTLFDDRWYNKVIRRVNHCYTLSHFNKALKDITPDVIHFHTVFYGMDKINFPINQCVFTFHSRVKRNFASARYRKPLMDRLVAKDIMLVAISSEIEKDINLYFKNAKSIIISNGLDLEEIRSKKTSKKVLCDELMIPKDSFLIGQVGRFHPVKNHSFTIELFSYIIRNYPNTYLLFVGTGNAKELQFIKKRIQELGLQNNIKLLGLRSDATSIMSCLDVLLMPSKSEALPLVMIEAQALGIRSVVSDSIPEDVICNTNCFRLSLDAPVDEWVSLVMGKSERKYSREIEDFGINRIIDKHLDVYKRITTE